MQRLFLILVLLATTSCELPSIIQADQYIEPIPVEATQNINVYDNVWDRIKITSTLEQENLDEKTLKYINAYLSNPAQFDKLLEKEDTLFILFLKN